jgi:NADH:ubiquinone reductase (H+-translocating)
MNGKTRPRVAIVGAGFGGLAAATALASAPVEIVVIDRQNFHTFQPLLYQVATAGLSPGEIAEPIRTILRRHKNIEVLMSDVSGFDLERRVVHTADHEVPYDALIVAAGASHAYFGHDEWEPFAPGLKTIEDALEIRRRVLLAFELAERRAFAGESEEPLNFVVVGAGPTGVELAGTLAEICRHALANDFRSIEPHRTRIYLLEGGPRVLPSYADDLSLSAQKQLEHLGVEVHTSALVTKIEPGVISIGDKRMSAAVILWAAGVAASPLGKKLGGAIDRNGRVLVNPDLSIPGHPEVFVIGDLASIKDQSGKLLPGVAPVAMSEGRFVAKTIRREVERSKSPIAASTNREPYRYRDKGSLATIGRAAAVAQFGKIHISGYIAWLAWLTIHIFFLIGFQNRILVLTQWAWSYLTNERGARLITGGTDLPGWEELHAQKPNPADSPQEIPIPVRKSA